MERSAHSARHDGLQLAIDRAGGIMALAHGLGMPQPSAIGWKRIPADRVLAIETMTGVARQQLRPDLYPDGGTLSSAMPNSRSRNPVSMPSMATHPPIGGHDGENVRKSNEMDAARAQEYLLLAGLLVQAPTHELLDRLSRIAGDPSPLGLAHEALADAARATTAEQVSTEYLALFVGVGRGEVLPYASLYRTGFLHGRPLAQIRADLARLGIVRQAGNFEPEDHLGLLLEVMATLVSDEPAAAATFFQHHIQPWARRLLADIEQAPSADFYRAVARLGRVWIEIEAEACTLPE